MPFLLLALLFALLGCGSDPSLPAAGDAAPTDAATTDAATPDASADASTDAEHHADVTRDGAADALDVTTDGADVTSGDAGPEASADVTEDAPSDDAAVERVTVPGPLDQHLYRLEVWSRRDSAPFALVPGARCVRAVGGRTAALTMTGARITFPAVEGAAGSSSLACPNNAALELSAVGATFERGPVYAPPGSVGQTRQSFRFLGTQTAEECGAAAPSTLEVYVFGCPQS